MDEHGQGRIGDGGEIFGDVFGVSMGGNMAKNSGLVHR
jgi:hypothetical protein